MDADEILRKVSANGDWLIDHLTERLKARRKEYRRLTINLYHSRHHGIDEQVSMSAAEFAEICEVYLEDLYPLLLLIFSKSFQTFFHGPMGKPSRPLAV